MLTASLTANGILLFLLIRYAYKYYTFTDYHYNQWKKFEMDYWRLRDYVKAKGIDNISLSWLNNGEIIKEEDSGEIYNIREN